MVERVDAKVDVFLRNGEISSTTHIHFISIIFHCFILVIILLIRQTKLKKMEGKEVHEESTPVVPGTKVTWKFSTKKNEMKYSIKLQTSGSPVIVQADTLVSCDVNPVEVCTLFNKKPCSFFFNFK